MQEQAEAPRKPRPRLGLLVRALIYVPLLAYFGWQASQRFLGERDQADDQFRASVEQWLHPTRTIIMPNGQTMPVLELTESEAKQMGLLPNSVAEPPTPPEQPTAPAAPPTEQPAEQPAL